MRRLAGPFYVVAGLMHFIKPRWYRSIMPPYVPAHRELVAASGVAEIIGGAALACPDPQIRRVGAWWMVATLIAVFPANLHMALNHRDYPVPGGRLALYARLPFQAVFIGWAWAAGRSDEG